MGIQTTINQCAGPASSFLGFVPDQGRSRLDLVSESQQWLIISETMQNTAQQHWLNSDVNKKRPMAMFLFYFISYFSIFLSFLQLIIWNTLTSVLSVSINSSVWFILAHLFRYIWAFSSLLLAISHLADSGIHLMLKANFFYRIKIEMHWMVCNQLNPNWEKMLSDKGFYCGGLLLDWKTWALKSYLHVAMAKIKGDVTLTISHRQSFTRYPMPENAMLPNVHERLSITPTSFLCSMSTHSTPGKKNKKWTSSPCKGQTSKKIFSSLKINEYIWFIWLLRTVETMTMPVIQNPVKNLSTANIT